MGNWTFQMSLKYMKKKFNILSTSKWLWDCITLWLEWLSSRKQSPRNIGKNAWEKKFTLLLELWAGAATWKLAWRFLKLKIDLMMQLYQCWVFSRRILCSILKRQLDVLLIAEAAASPCWLTAALTHDSQLWNDLGCLSADWWLKKICSHNRVLFSYKEQSLLIVGKYVELKVIMLRKIRRSRKTHLMLSFIWRI